MALPKIPAVNTLTDGQIIQVANSNGLATSYSYDAQSNSLIGNESEILFAELHGASHILQDPIPNASCNLPGLMSADDKCKLDSILQTRIGVLGYTGSGMPNDGGWMNGEVILAAGSEFISIERVGNVIRFNVDAPIPLNCNIESCAQIFWVQDETDVNAIRPPSCAGRLPGVNGYGELKFYLFPSNTLVSANDVGNTIGKKGNYPSLVFKRYDNSSEPGLGSFDVTLRRNPGDRTSANIGWYMSPGPTNAGECVWFMGTDSDGNQIRFDLKSESNSLTLGSLLYGGHLLTKQMAVITDYIDTTDEANQYVLRLWDPVTEKFAGDTITATNMWGYNNPGGPSTGVDAQRLITDGTRGKLAIGTIVDLWWFKIGVSGGTDIRRHFFVKEPQISADTLWDSGDMVQFGDISLGKKEIDPSTMNDDDKNSAQQFSAIHDLNTSTWGIHGFVQPVYQFSDFVSNGDVLTPNDLSSRHNAVIDEALPALKVVRKTAADPFSERPIVLWNKVNRQNGWLTAYVGMSDDVTFPAYDFLLRSRIDEKSGKHVRIIGTGTLSGDNSQWVIVKGLNYYDLNNEGAIQLMSGSDVGAVWAWTHKAAYPSLDDDAVALIGADAAQLPFSGNIGDIADVLPIEYENPCVRIRLTPSGANRSMQVLVGKLKMDVAYQSDLVVDDIDDYVRGMDDYVASGIYTQNGTFNGTGTPPSSSHFGFKIFEGGTFSSVEYWNKVDILYKGNEVWVWWNDLMIPPDSTATDALPGTDPVTGSTFKLPITPTNGKIGVRMWPGAKLRHMSVRGQISSRTELFRAT